MQVKWQDKYPAVKWIIPLVAVVILALPSLWFLVEVCIGMANSGVGTSTPDTPGSITELEPIITEPSGSGSSEPSVLSDFILVLVFLLPLLSAVECFVIHGNRLAGRRTFSRQVMLLNKLGMIPVFIAGSLLLLLLGFLIMFPGGIGAITIIPVMVFLGWVLMMCGSAWGIAYVAGLRRDGVISGGLCVLHIVMQCFFVLDVVSAIILFAAYRKYDLGRAAPAQQPPYQQMPPLQQPIPQQAPYQQMPPMQQPYSQVPPQPMPQMPPAGQPQQMPPMQQPPQNQVPPTGYPPQQPPQQR